MMGYLTLLLASNPHRYGEGGLDATLVILVLAFGTLVAAKHALIGNRLKA